MSSNDALNDEIEALSSIYDGQVLEITSSDPITAVLSLPNGATSFTISFPETYPDVPPSILGTHHVSSHSKKGQGDYLVKVLREKLGTIYTPGQVVLFDLIEEINPLLQVEGEEQEPVYHEHDQVEPDVQHQPPETELKWTVSEPLIVAKSVFVARALTVHSTEEAKAAVDSLLDDRKIASATHNITAWRIGHDDVVVQDCDDDGETAAGGRMLHLMQLTDVWNVVVIVSRWYGGVKLGPDRFRCINSVAREVLVAGGWVKEKGKKAKK